MNDLVEAFRPMVEPLLQTTMQQLSDIAHTQPLVIILAPCAAFLALAIKGVFRR